MSKIFIFIPDTKLKSGFGHYYRCLKFSNFIKKKKIYFLINREFSKKIIKKEKKINYIFYKNINNSLEKIQNKFGKDKINILVDTYDGKILKINFSKFSKKSFAILDYKLNTKIENIIDHTFERTRSYYNYLGNKKKIFCGLDYFPINKLENNKKKKDIILINFGSVNKPNLILKSIKLLIAADFQKYKIYIINNFKRKINLKHFKIKNKVFFVKYSNDINRIYKRTLFCIGSCAFPFERSYLKIPSIVKCVAKNQKTNYKNFINKKCVISLDEFFKKTIFK